MYRERFNGEAFLKYECMKLTFNVIEDWRRIINTVSYSRHHAVYDAMWPIFIVIAHSCHKSLDICQFQRKYSSRWTKCDKNFRNTIWTNDLNECLLYFVECNINIVKDLLNSWQVISPWNLHDLTFITRLRIFI